ncbi:DUF2071 domain-containing protein [Halalkalicoccus sp. GCM10025322]|uniref:DUF2071 domain-containing protein n=1 Tax=Halalkalicoccus TaxID=332246 RepID=UPI002F969F3B
MPTNRCRGSTGDAFGWRHLLFANWPIDADRLDSYPPDVPSVQTYDGVGWLTTVPFVNVDTRSRGLPEQAGFDVPELNLRTYVTHEGEPGIYFCSLDARSVATVFEAGLSIRKPAEYAVSAPLRLHQNLDDVEFVEDFTRRAERTIGGMDVPGETYREVVEEPFEENRVIENEPFVGGKPVALDAIDPTVLVVVGAEDEFVPPGAYEPFLDRVPSDDTAAIEFPTAHVGLSVAPPGPRGGMAGGV